MDIINIIIIISLINIKAVLIQFSSPSFWAHSGIAFTCLLWLCVILHSFHLVMIAEEASLTHGIYVSLGSFRWVDPLCWYWSCRVKNENNCFSHNDLWLDVNAAWVMLTLLMQNSAPRIGVYHKLNVWRKIWDIGKVANWWLEKKNGYHVK